jgi:DNA-binding MurR/RpiR family transcriptional regulator
MCNVRYIGPRTASTSISARLARTTLSPALRRVAELLLVDPEAIAFGTVASVAERAGTSTPSVVRLATALGFTGFSDLRDAARAELSVRLNTDAVRVRAEPVADPVAALLSVEQHNLDATLGALDQATVDALVDLLDDDGRALWVLPSTQTAGVALRFADQLMIVRDGVTLLDGSEMRVMSLTRALRRGDVLLSMDVPRHELATVRVQGDAVRRGAVPVVLTGSVPVALDTSGGHLLTFACESVGPFDSLVGLTALATLLVNGLVSRRRATSARRLGALERTWTTTGLFDA